jgi:hypothetical protein
VRFPAPKITRAKGTGGVAQAEEQLCCKCKALRSNSSLAKTAYFKIPKSSLQMFFKSLLDDGYVTSLI